SSASTATCGRLAFRTRSSGWLPAVRPPAAGSLRATRLRADRDPDGGLVGRTRAAAQQRRRCDPGERRRRRRMSLRTARRFATGQPGQPVAMPHDPAHPARDLLAVFVNDHLAVVAGGQALARRAAASAGPAPLADALRDTGELLAAQASALRELLRRQGLREQRAKQWLAIAGERAGRLKLNGRVVRPSPL